MRIDPEYLRKQYGSLSDWALLAINREDLVEIAQQCYDAELAQRKLAPIRRPDDLSDGELENEGDKPDWLGEAAEVYSWLDQAGTEPASYAAATARDALEAAGIPCYLELGEILEKQGSLPEGTPEWRLMVPPDFNLRATSILERDTFNQEFEAEWRTHLKILSDSELLAVSPQEAFCGLFDRVERVTRVYAEEIARRELK